MKIIVFGLAQAKEFTSITPYGVISIISRPETELILTNDSNRKQHLILHFWDFDPCDKIDPNGRHDPKQIIGFGNEVLGTIADLSMQPSHAEQIVDFLDKFLADGLETLVVHCEAGLSRSPSIAAAIADYFGIERREIDARTCCVEDGIPNIHCYSLITKALRNREVIST